ncbi:MAG: Coenzyme F420:L-glutamate ligase [Methanoregulaceae archaeon PtaB.Bin009]|jgi:coenzyme F420-0:L-glutamate ligase|nr:MAG: Coenzyme F420:L-glutamate ligase [Methanoregulaceae archaeon PtaB.Bin009]OPY41396.1 MAG: Coenzyme F420:L-glutamate ligase [Methanoregulaceae archaeon PtaU1.Bin066]HNQ29586.1 coenzyme F420-0:L-glutamate ligase [Methanolinea sp.]
MNSSFTTIGIRTPLIREGDEIASILVRAIRETPAREIQDGDILVVAETAISTAEGRVVRLESVVPDRDAQRLAHRYGMDPALVQCILDESDEVVGGIPGFLLCMKHGTLLPNAGVDASNAPPGCVTPLPADPDASALRIKEVIELLTGVRVGVIVADSRTHAMRVGCSGVAIGCAGIPSVMDARGRTDLFGRPLMVTRLALADNLASAAEVVMGEADERTPAAVIRGLGIQVTDISGIESINAEECIFMGLLKQERKRQSSSSHRNDT